MVPRQALKVTPFVSTMETCPRSPGGARRGDVVGRDLVRRTGQAPLLGREALGVSFVVLAVVATVTDVLAAAAPTWSSSLVLGLLGGGMWSPHHPPPAASGDLRSYCALAVTRPAPARTHAASRPNTKPPTWAKKATLPPLAEALNNPKFASMSWYKNH